MMDQRKQNLFRRWETAVFLMGLWLVFSGPVELFSKGEESTAEAGISMLDQRLIDLINKQAVLYQKIAKRKRDPGFDDYELEPEVREISQRYEELIASNPDELLPYVLYGKFARKIGDTRKAHELFLRANMIDPEVAVVKQQIGNYMAEEGKHEIALSYFLKAIELSPDTALYHFQLGELLNHFKEAFLKDRVFKETHIDENIQQAFRKAAELEPDNRDFRMRYGESFYDIRNPDWERALGVWEGMEMESKTDLEEDVIRCHIAFVLVKLDRIREAEEELSDVIDPKMSFSRARVLKEIDRLKGLDSEAESASVQQDNNSTENPVQHIENETEKTGLEGR